MKKRVPVLDTLIPLHIQQPAFLAVILVCPSDSGSRGTVLHRRSHRLFCHNIHIGFLGHGAQPRPQFLPQAGGHRQAAEEHIFQNRCSLIQNKQQREQFCDAHCLGHLLSYSPVGEDGIFPHEAVRDCIEKLHSEKLVNGFIVGKENQRGVHSVTGGLAEKEIAEKYQSNANALRIMYPQTAAILDKLSECYRAESLYEQKRELLDYRG